MSDNLIIFGANRECRDHPLFKSIDNKYRNIVIACNESTIQGFRDVDILFLRDWWCRRSSRKILEVLEVYIFTCNSTIIGDRKYLPPYLVDKYIYKCDKSKNNLYSGTNRFEILDL